jgi:signal transduction histidine kinase
VFPVLQERERMPLSVATCPEGRRGDLILRSRGDAEKIERLAQGAMKAAQRGEHLVRQLLTYARKQITRPDTVNLNQLIVNIENLMHRVIGAQIEVVTMLSPARPAANAGRGRYRAPLR